MFCEDDSNEKNIQGEEWKQSSYFMEMKVKKAPFERLDLQRKVVIGRVAFHHGRKIFQLKEYNDCNAWNMNCADCGLCPSWDDVAEVATPHDVEGALDSINVEGLIEILFSKGFPLNFTPPKPIYISLKGVDPYFRAVYWGQGRITIEGFEGICGACIIREYPYWSIKDFMSFILMRSIKKQILKGLIRYWRGLIM